jgi:hypothetical protein
VAVRIGRVFLVQRDMLDLVSRARRGGREDKQSEQGQYEMWLPTGAGGSTCEQVHGKKSLGGFR